MHPTIPVGGAAGPAEPQTAPPVPTPVLGPPENAAQAVLPPAVPNHGAPGLPAQSKPAAPPATVTGRATGDVQFLPIIALMGGLLGLFLAALVWNLMQDPLVAEGHPVAARWLRRRALSPARIAVGIGIALLPVAVVVALVIAGR